MGVYTKQSAILFGHGKVQRTKNPLACLEQVSNEKPLSTIFSNHILVMRTHSTGSPTKDRPTEHSTIAKADCPFDDNTRNTRRIGYIDRFGLAMEVISAITQEKEKTGESTTETADDELVQQ